MSEGRHLIKLVASPGLKFFQHVTVTRSQSHEISGTSDDSGIHDIAKKEVLELIKETNGSISFNAAIQSACSRNQSVINYLGDKLTSRENKKVRRLAEIIHHENIEIIKTRPEIILRWTNTMQTEKNPSEEI